MCDKQPPAVLIDLDPDKGTFDLDDPPAAAPGLSEQLAALRAAGIVVLWQASLPAAQSERLYSTLAATGLDLDRTDRLLLLRKTGERKQARRQAAARDWCILAIAGDSKGDFEEAFLYLRDPNGAIAQALGSNLGDGWFLTPQPIH
jgi:predicted secreted acid phosphatase